MHDKRLLAVILDSILISFAFTLALLLRFDFQSNLLTDYRYPTALISILIIKLIVFTICGYYRKPFYRYMSLSDLIKYFTGSFIATLLILGIMCFNSISSLFITEASINIMLKSVFILDCFLQSLLLCSSRLIVRIYTEIQVEKKPGNIHKDNKAESVVTLMLKKERFKTIVSTFILLITAGLFTFATETKYWPINVFSFNLIIGITTVLISRHWLYEYRIAKGLYGGNKYEAKEILSFICQESKNRDFTDGDGKIYPELEEENAHIILPSQRTI